jgi:hypothetical protein
MFSVNGFYPPQSPLGREGSPVLPLAKGELEGVSQETLNTYGASRRHTTNLRCALPICTSLYFSFGMTSGRFAIVSLAGMPATKHPVAMIKATIMRELLILFRVCWIGLLVVLRARKARIVFRFNLKQSTLSWENLIKS